jgi:hypothetical protein
MSAKVSPKDKKYQTKILHNRMMELICRLTRDMLYTYVHGIDTVKSTKNQLLAMAQDLYIKLVGLNGSFEELLGAWQAHGYRPTMRVDADPRFEVLADLYDYFQALNNRNVTAYRG